MKGSSSSGATGLAGNKNVTGFSRNVIFSVAGRTHSGRIWKDQSAFVRKSSGKGTRWQAWLTVLLRSPKSEYILQVVHR